MVVQPYSFSGHEVQAWHRAQQIRRADGIPRNGDRDRASTPETNPAGNNINLRGVTPIGIEIRDGMKIESGRWFTPGRREVVVGKNVAERYTAAQIGSKLQFGKGDWEIVGIMSQGTSAINSELWVDLNQAAADYNRSEVLSSVLVRAVDTAAVQSLINDLQADQRLNVAAVTEQNTTMPR